MSLQTQIKSAAREAFIAVGDVAVAATYLSVASGAYNATTGTRAGTSTSYSLSRVIVEQYAAIEVDGTAVQVGDQKVHLLVEDLSATPKVTDTITVNGAEWTVVNVMQDPARVLWTLQLRK